MAAAAGAPEGFDLETGDKEEYFTGIKQAFHMRQLDSGTGKEQKAIDVTAAMETMDIMSMTFAQSSPWPPGRWSVLSVYFPTAL